MHTSMLRHACRFTCDQWPAFGGAQLSFPYWCPAVTVGYTGTTQPSVEREEHERKERQEREERERNERKERERKERERKELDRKAAIKRNVYSNANVPPSKRKHVHPTYLRRRY